MNQFKLSLFAPFALLALAGCVTATPYQPAAGYGDGYAEQKLEDNRYKVTFAGNSSTPRQTVENYLLYRAAEITLQNGYDYFLMVDKDTEADTRYNQTYTGFGYGYGWYHWYPRSAIGVSGGTSNPVTEYEAQANILVFKGEKPADNPAAFDARQIKTHLEASIVRPEAKG